MKIGQMTESKFLKKEDVDPAKLVTIRGLTQQNVAMDNQPPDLKWCLHFTELAKPMVVNSTNLQLCAMALGSEETDDWIGKQIVLFNDPNVSFAGKLTGGIRIRARRPQAAPQNTPQPQSFVPPPYVAPVAPGPTPFDQFDDDIPF